MTSPRDELQALEHQAFDAFTAISFALTSGLAQRFMLTGNGDAMVAAYLPAKDAEGKQPPSVNFVAETGMGALMACGLALNSVIHRAHAEGAPVQAFLEMCGHAREMRKKPMIIQPGSN